MQLDLNLILAACAIVAGVVAVFELLEYVFTKNLPWLARMGRNTWRQLRRRLWRRVQGDQGRFLILNFSSHPVPEGQQAAIQARMGWPASEVLDAQVGSVPEDHRFLGEALKVIDRLGLTPAEWQTLPLVVIPAGYAPVWSVLLPEIHGRLGYFPDLARLRPVDRPEKYELAEIVDLRRVRNQARSKR
jgi:hypothetical protein